jgi:hypothetical protein
MQTELKHIYQTLAEETGKSEELYKDIGSFIFRETSRMLKEPSSLILKLRGIGSWHLRKRRMEIMVNEWQEIKPKAREEFNHEYEYQSYNERYKRYINFKERLKEYDKYLEIKQEVRLKRNETQVLLEPDQGED